MDTVRFRARLAARMPTPVEFSTPPLAPLSPQYKWKHTKQRFCHQRSVVPQFRSLSPNQMVSVTFKAVYLFLALFALPQVLSAPAIVALDVRHNTPTREETVKQSLEEHNKIRAPNRKGYIDWSTDLEREAWNHVSSCKVELKRGRDSTLSNGLSLFTEDTHV